MLFHAAFANPPAPEGGRAQLVCRQVAVSPGSDLELGIYLEPTRGWHTYWSNPGDSGGPTRVILNLPRGWTRGEVQFPTPTRINLAGIVSYGYDSPELLVIPVHAASHLSEDSFTINAKVEWLTCTSELCKPADQQVTLVLRRGAASPSKWESSFEKFDHLMPAKSSSVVWSARRTSQGFDLACSHLPWGHESEEIAYFFPGKPGVIDHSGDETLVRSGSTAILKMKKSPYMQKPPERLTGVFSLFDRKTKQVLNSYRVDVPVEP